MRSKRPADMTVEELEFELIIGLSILSWHNLSSETPDPEAVESYATGRDGGKHSIHILSKYADGLIVLVGTNDTMDGWRRSSMDQFKIDWLWAKVVEAGEDV